MAWVLFVFVLSAATVAVVLLDRMRREEDREERAHRDRLLRELRRHHSDT